MNEAYVEIISVQNLDSTEKTSTVVGRKGLMREPHIGYGLIVEYTYPREKVGFCLHTSPVNSISTLDNIISVTTSNSIYNFKLIKE